MSAWLNWRTGIASFVLALVFAFSLFALSDERLTAGRSRMFWTATESLADLLEQAING